MTNKEIITALRRNMVETGSLICLGCGYEYSCATRGCAIMRSAADAIEQFAVADNKPLTLEELRGMDGEPVWIENRAHSEDNGYYLVNLKYEQYFDKPDCVCEVLMNQKGEFFMMNNVGKGLTVYVHKLEQE